MYVLPTPTSQIYVGVGGNVLVYLHQHNKSMLV